MDPIIKKLMRTFESDTRNNKDRYHEFLFYCYQCFDKKTKSKKSKKLINKYDNDRHKLIQYLIANEKAITLELTK